LGGGHVGGHFKLDSLVCIVDRNQLGIDGRTEDVMAVEPIEDRFTSFGWEVQRIDGHSVDQIVNALDTAKLASRQPHVIIADTVKGKGVKRMELDVNWHVGNLSPRTTKRSTRNFSREVRDDDRCHL